MRYEIKAELNTSKELVFNDGSRVLYKLYQVENGYQMSIEETTNNHFPDTIKTGSSITFDGIGDHFEFGADSLYLIK